MRFWIVLLSLLLAIVSEGTAAARPWVILFGSRDCEECASLKEDWSTVGDLENGPILFFLPMEEPSNYRLLGRIEERLQVQEKSTTFPVLLIGHRLIVGADAFYEQEGEMASQLENLLRIPETEGIVQAAEQATSLIVEYIAPVTAGQMDAASAAAIDSLANSGPAVPRVLLFYQKNCRKCSRQELELNVLSTTLPTLEVRPRA